jgi:hypothetical protein
VQEHDNDDGQEPQGPAAKVSDTLALIHGLVRCGAARH